MAGNVDMQSIYAKAWKLAEKGNDAADGSNRKDAYELVKKYYDENSQNPEYLWRLAHLTYIYMQTFVMSDKNRHKELCFEAHKYAFAALDLDKENPQVHKYCAMTLGSVNDYVGTDEKIKNGHAMKHHIDEALKRRSDDRTLHHLLGRWSYNVAGLSWLERKVASALFSSPPESSYDDALKSFLKAAELEPNWKENEMYIALCYEQLKDKAKAKEWLQKADSIPIVSPDDEAADKEIKKLLAKY